MFHSPEIKAKNSSLLLSKLTKKTPFVLNELKDSESDDEFGNQDMDQKLSISGESSDQYILSKQETCNNEQDQKIILISGGDQIGKVNVKHPKCEDAYFISEGSFGLADGVSGWNDYGFSSDEFSNQLMKNAKELLEQRY